MKCTRRLRLFLYFAGSTLCLTSCTVTIGADGSKSATVDGAGAAQVIQATK